MSRVVYVVVSLTLVALSVHGQDSLEVIGAYDGVTSMVKYDMGEVDRIIVNAGVFQADPVLTMSWPLLFPVRKLVFSTALPNAGCASVGTKTPAPRAGGLKVIAVSALGRTTMFHLDPGAAGLLSIDIHGSDGKLVKRLSSSTQPGIPTSLAWNRENIAEESCAPGVYHLTAKLDGYLIGATTFAAH